MPDKSRRRRGKYSIQSKKKKRRPSHPSMLARQPGVAQTQEPVTSPAVSVPSAPMTKPTAIRYPYIATELRTIGILAGVMLIALIVLALVLS